MVKQTAKEEIKLKPQTIKFFEGLLAAALDGIVITDPSQNIIVANDVFCSYFGQDRNNMIETNLFDWISQCEDFTPVEWSEINKEVRLNGYSRNNEARITVTGKLKYFSINASIQSNIDGKNEYIISIWRDISDSKKAEEEIRKLTRLVKQSPTTVVITDDKGTIEYVNPQFTKVTGYSSEEAIGQNPRILKSGEQSPEIYKQLWQTITAGEDWRGELLNKMKNGSLIWETISISPIKDDSGKITHFAAVKIDDTKRKLAENALKRSEQFLQNIFDGIQDGITVLDKDLNILRVNAAIEKMYSHSLPLTGKKCYKVFHGTSSPCAFCPTIRAIEKGKLQMNVLPLTGSKGKTGWLELYSFPFKDDADNVVGVIESVRDITERKQTEDKLELYRNKLKRLVAIRSKELKATHNQLIHSEKLAAIGKLSASIAHEFNNPICGIRNVLEIVAEDIDKKENLELINIAISECDRMANLIGKLRDFHRPTAGTTTSIKIREAINDICVIYKKKLKERKIKLETSYDNDNLMVECVPDQIKQVLLNIIQNAEESIPEKGGKIILSVDHDDLNAFIKIKDSGGGIPEQHIDNIFEPFFTTKSATKGTGLGLAICYGIIKNHKGDIKVKSHEGKGTTFTIILPIIGADS